MKKPLRLLLGVIVLSMGGSGILFAQEISKPYSYTFTNGISDCLFPNTTVDQVWMALTKTFMTQDMKHRGSWKESPVILDRPSNRMIGVWLTGHGLTLGERRLEILLEQRDGGVGVYCTSNYLAPKKYKIKVEQDFYDRVAEILYGK